MCPEVCEAGGFRLDGDFPQSFWDKVLLFQATEGVVVCSDSPGKPGSPAPSRSTRCAGD